MTTGDRSALVRELLAPHEIEQFDLLGLPDLVRSRKSSVEQLEETIRPRAETWSAVQEHFLRDYAGHAEVYPVERLRRDLADDTALFGRIGLLRGRVLDVGGGWGLFRQYWDAGDDGIFVVHDPGVTRHIEGAFPSHQEVFAQAFSRPMTFVEGVGEHLPYRVEVFDTVLCAGALDHCADPDTVLRAAHRVLRPGGRLVVLQRCTFPDAKRRLASLARRVLRVLREPSKIGRRFRQPRSELPEHMFSFTTEGLTRQLQSAGFERVEEVPIRDTRIAFQAYRP